MFCWHLSGCWLKQLFASHDPVDDAPGNQLRDEPSGPCGAGVCHISLKAEMRPCGLLLMNALAPSSGVIYSLSRGLALND